MTRVLIILMVIVASTFSLLACSSDALEPFAVTDTGPLLL